MQRCGTPGSLGYEAARDESQGLEVGEKRNFLFLLFLVFRMTNKGIGGADQTQYSSVPEPGVLARAAQRSRAGDRCQVM